VGCQARHAVRSPHRQAWADSLLLAWRAT
jgi:hypothetical protein